MPVPEEATIVTPPLVPAKQLTFVCPVIESVGFVEIEVVTWLVIILTQPVRGFVASIVYVPVGDAGGVNVKALPVPAITEPLYAKPVTFNL